MLKEIKVKINEKEYVSKANMLTFLKFEKLTGQPLSKADFEYIEIQLQLLYAALLANNKDFNYDFEDFVGTLDDNPTILTDFQTIVNEDVVEKKAANKKK